MPEVLEAPPAPAPLPSLSPIGGHPDASPPPNMAEAFGDLDELAGEPRETPKPPEPAKPAPEPAKADIPAAKPAPKAAEKPPEPAKAPPKPAEKPPDKPADKAPEKMAPKELREAYESLKAKLREREEEATKVKAELEAVKKAPPPEDPEKKTLAERLSERETRLQKLEEELRYAAYEQTDEYQQHYNRYQRAWQRGHDVVTTLTKADGTPATPRDFERLVNTASEDEAATLAEELFGPGAKANSAMNHRNHIRDMNQACHEAKAEWRTKGAERLKAAEAARIQRAKELEGIYKTALKEAEDKYPQWFKPPEDDEKAAELLAEGLKMVDETFSKAQELPPDVLVRRHAAIRNRAGAFSRVVHDLKTAKDRIAQLEKELADYHNSTPGKGEITGEPPTKELSAEEEIERLVME